MNIKFLNIKCPRLFLCVGFVLFLCAQLNAEILPGNNDFDAYLPLLNGKRVAIFTNISGTLTPYSEEIKDESLPEIPTGEHILDALLERGVNVSCVLTPEHGFRGDHDAGAVVSDSTDPKTGVKTISLYGVDAYYALGRAEKEFDIVLVDIQDIGLRYYTYYVTMMRLINVCAERKKPVIILDRPNPNGYYADGPMLEQRYISNVGALRLPVVHGLTLGEMANMMNGEGWLRGKRKCDIQVIPCRNYTHSKKFRLNCRPSPNIKSMRAVYLYASLCYFENTLVSVARGTEYPFEVYGSPLLKDKTGYEFSFIPKSIKGAQNPPFMNQECYGHDLRQLTLEEMQTDGINLSYLISAYNAISQHNFFGRPDKRGRYWIDLLFGTDRIRKMIEAGKTENEIKSSWQKDINEFKELRKKYLLYDE